MNSLVYGVATREWEGWQACVESWMRTASEQYPSYIVKGKPILEAFQQIYKNTSEPIIALCHDDLMIYEQDWDKRVLAQFDDSQVGLAGFGGALGHGTPNLYTVPYHLPNLARQGFLSNMRSAEVHGKRFTGERDVAILDGMALFVRRSVLDKWGGWPKEGVGYFMYAEALCCEVRRQGLRIRLVGVDFEHLGGKTVAIDGAHDDYQEAHAYFYEHNKDVMPYRVKE